MTKPNIHPHTAAICKKLGLEPNMVRRLDITPSGVIAEVYLADENGSKYMVPTQEALPTDDVSADVSGFSRAPAIETRTFEVTA